VPLAGWQRQESVGKLARLALTCFHGLVNAIVIEVERRRDGGYYPLGGSLPLAERGRAIRLAHALVCRDKLPYRQAQAAMLAQHGIRRSLGQVYKDVRGYACPVCEPEAFTGG
jgi:hypothetical protein